MRTKVLWDAQGIEQCTEQSLEAMHKGSHNYLHLLYNSKIQIAQVSHNPKSLKKKSFISPNPYSYDCQAAS